MHNKRYPIRVLAGVGLGLLVWGCSMATANNPGAFGPRLATPAATVAQQGAYSCPMHSAVVGQAGDRCPKCGMNLEPSKAAPYVCPMHTEVTGKAGDDCPKCGMELEPKEGATAPGGIGMRFSTEPTSSLKPNQPVNLIMTPVSKEKRDVRIGLDVEHEKKVHLIVVNEDLSWFDHIHPEEESDGSYRVAEKFPAPGRYTLFADYKPTGGDHLVDRLNVNIEGTSAPAKTYGSDRMTSDAGDGFSAVLTLEGGDLVADLRERDGLEADLRRTSGEVNRGSRRPILIELGERARAAGKYGSFISQLFSGRNGFERFKKVSKRCFFIAP